VFRGSVNFNLLLGEVLMQLKDHIVKLRELRMTDAGRITELANNEKISVNLRDGFPHPYTLADAERFLASFTDNNPQSLFAIEFEGEHVGNISLLLGSDVYRKSAEIGYFIGEPYWNKGIATAAVNLITRYGFTTLDLVRIHTGVFEYNPASMRVLEKCGFVREGIFRRSVIKNGKIWDEIRYALIRP